IPQLAAYSQSEDEWASVRDYVWDVPKTFLLTISNPGAVLGLIAIFGGVSSFVEVRSTIEALWLVAAIVCGSLLWWIFLSTMVGRIRHLVTESRLSRINRAAGGLLIVFGGLLVAELALKALHLTWRAVGIG